MNQNLISSLTVSEFTELMLGFITQNNNYNKAISLIESLEPPNETDITNIGWVAVNANYKLSTIKSMVSRETIPCVSRKKPLQFSKKAIIEWMENGRPKPKNELDFIPKRKRKNDAT